MPAVVPAKKITNPIRRNAGIVKVIILLELII
jgi:hypothetical protein